MSQDREILPFEHQFTETGELETEFEQLSEKLKELRSCNIYRVMTEPRDITRLQIVENYRKIRDSGDPDGRLARHAISLHLRLESCEESLRSYEGDVVDEITLVVTELAFRNGVTPESVLIERGIIPPPFMEV